MPARLPCIALLVKVSSEFDHNLGGYLQQTIEKRSKVVFSDPMKTFEIWKLGN